MKKLFLLLLTTVPLICSSQNLHVENKAKSKQNQVFEPDNKVFVRKKKSLIIQKTIFLRTENDSVFFKSDSFALSELASIRKQGVILNGIYYTLTAGEIFGTGIQIVGTAHSFGIAYEYQTDEWVISYTALETYLYFVLGSTTKQIFRALKYGLFETMMLRHKKVEFSSVRIEE